MSVILIKQKSITLIELVIAVAIIAVITVAGLVSFSVLGPRRIEAEARKILADVCWSREMTVVRHDNYIIDLNSTNDTYIIYRGSVNPANEIKRQNLEVDLVSLTDFAGNPISPAQITFSFPKGTTQDRIINLTYQNNSRRLRLFGTTAYVKIE